MIRGFTSGVFDLFHVGHLKLLKNARKHCDYLVVGVCSDELTFRLKNKKPVIPCEVRCYIISLLPQVNKVIVKHADNDGYIAYKNKCSIIFKGSDHKNTNKWNYLTVTCKVLGIKTKILPRTKNISSSKLRRKIF